MKKEKIVLFGPKAGVGFQAGLPLALLAIARFLAKDERFEIKIISSIAEKDYVNKVLSEAEEALCLGISCFTGYPIREALEVASAVKQKYPDLPIIFGGWHPSILPTETLNNYFVDVIVVGQGEKPFTDLANALISGDDLSKIKGLSFKDKKGEVISTGFSELEDINNFPMLPYRLLDMDKFIFKTFYATKTIDYYSSVGCPFNCTFCVEPQMNKRKWFGLSADKVLNEWEVLNKDYGINGVNLVDTNCCVSEKRIRDIAQGLLDRNFKFGWGPADGRIDQLLNYSDETWRVMKASGCASVLVGAESALDEGLEIVDKHIKVGDILELVKLGNHHKIGIGLSFMIGLPGSDRDFIKREYKAILKLFDKLYTKLSCLHLFLYAPYPGSRLYQVSQSNGFKPPLTLEGWSKFELQTVQTPWVPQKYRDTAGFLQDYVLRFMDGGFKDIIDNRKNVFIRTVFKTLYPLLYLFAILRWKLRFFKLPIELKLVKLARRFF